MTDKDVFQHLFTVAKSSKDPRGVVTACLVKNGEIIATAASSDDGVRHAEDVLFKHCRENGIPTDSEVTLYATLEPCNKRSVEGRIDCVTQIIDGGVSEVVFGARDPLQSDETARRLNAAHISIRQSSDSDVVKRSAEIFNESVTDEHKGVDVELKPED